MPNDSLDGKAGIFFVAKGELLLHTCSLEDAEPYGDFLNYPESHDEVWRREYFRKYNVDFDYYPRGRIVYNEKTGVYLLYCDKCISREAEELRRRYPEGKCIISLDEHYQCCKCNRHYVM